MLGKPLQTFRPKLATSALGVGVVGFGAGALWWFSQRVGGAPPAVLGFAVVSSVLALVLLVSLIRDATLRVVAHEHGVAWRRAGETHELAFAEIRRIHELSSSLLIYHKAGGKPLTLPTKVIDHRQLLAHLNIVAPQLPKATVRLR